MNNVILPPFIQLLDELHFCCSYGLTPFPGRLSRVRHFLPRSWAGDHGWGGSARADETTSLLEWQHCPLSTLAQWVQSCPCNAADRGLGPWAWDQGAKELILNKFERHILHVTGQGTFRWQFQWDGGTVGRRWHIPDSEGEDSGSPSQSSALFHRS